MVVLCNKQSGMTTNMISFFSYLFLAWVALNGFIISSTEGVEVEPTVPPSPPLGRSSFPDGFIFGTGSAAYQIEGAANIDGRGPCIWDNFTKEHPEKIADGSNGDVAADFYHRYEEDIKIMKEMGLDSFRFSISWSRLFPKGRISGGVNRPGVHFYNNSINLLISNGMKPFVTLLHFDTPQALEDQYNGLLSPAIVKDFTDYADFCFKTFGDRVKLWVTLNEPNLWSIYGYNYGVHAPGRCSDYNGNCSAGNSATEPYTAAHHLLLAHAAAVKLYRDKYQAHQKGQIGITIMTHWFQPKFPIDVVYRDAASRALDFLFGWFAHPVIYGDYPQNMKSLVGNRLPKFSRKQSKLLEGSLDFLGLNYYTAYYVEPAPPNPCNAGYVANRRATLTRNRLPKLSEMQSKLLEGSLEFLGLSNYIPNYAESAPLLSACNASYDRDTGVTQSSEKNGIPIGTPTDLNWLFVYPKGLYDVLLYVKVHYKNPPIIITENGFADASDKTFEDTVNDTARKEYIEGHLSAVLQAIKERVNVKGYYIWSHLDVFEWSTGYTARFGLIFVDYKNNLMRHVKDSARWLRMFLLK